MNGLYLNNEWIVLLNVHDYCQPRPLNGEAIYDIMRQPLLKFEDDSDIDSETITDSDDDTDMSSSTEEETSSLDDFVEHDTDSDCDAEYVWNESDDESDDNVDLLASKGAETIYDDSQNDGLVETTDSDCEARE